MSVLFIEEVTLYLYALTDNQTDDVKNVKTGSPVAHLQVIFFSFKVGNKYWYVYSRGILDQNKIKIGLSFIFHSMEA